MNLQDEPMKVPMRAFHPDGNADVFLFAGCRDDQTSADTQGLAGHKEASGAMTFAFLEAQRNPIAQQSSYGQLITQIRAILKVALCLNAH